MARAPPRLRSGQSGATRPVRSILLCPVSNNREVAEQGERVFVFVKNRWRDPSTTLGMTVE